MGAHPGLTADGVELVAEVVAIQPRFAPYNDLGPGLLRHTADARRFVRNAGSKYDVVVADLFHPARDGAGSLYTVDHYAAIRGLLDERGLACQWLPLYQLDAPTLQSIVRSFMAVFSNTHAFLLRPNVDTPVLGLVGWVSQPSFGPSWWDRRATNFALQDKLKTAGLGDGYQCFGTWLAGPAQLRAYADGAPLNTDDSLYVQYSAPRAAWRQNAPHSALLLDLLDRFAGEGAEFPCQATDLKARQWLAHLADFRAARDDYLRGAVADDAGRKPEAEQLYLTSAHRSPDFTTAYATLLTRAMAQARENPTEARRILSALIAARPERPIASDLLKRMEGL
jgi:spermidine synthase